MSSLLKGMFTIDRHHAAVKLYVGKTLSVGFVSSKSWSVKEFDLVGLCLDYKAGHTPTECI